VSNTLPVTAVREDGSAVVGSASQAFSQEEFGDNFPGWISGAARGTVVWYCWVVCLAVALAVTIKSVLTKLVPTFDEERVFNMFFFGLTDSTMLNNARR
jgi:hypothetical protein